MHSVHCTPNCASMTGIANESSSMTHWYKTSLDKTKFNYNISKSTTKSTTMFASESTFESTTKFAFESITMSAYHTPRAANESK